MRRVSWVLLFVLGGCQLKSSYTGPGQASSASSSSAPASGEPSSSSGSSTDRVPVPDLTGKTPEEATAVLRAAGLNGPVEVNRMALECIGAPRVEGRINCQNPDVGKLAYRSSPINVTVYAAPTHAGRITREQLEVMVGMTIDDAKKYLKSLGHDGPVNVREQHTFDPKCGSRKVCDGGPGTGLHDQIDLVINPSSNADITMPD